MSLNTRALTITFAVLWGGCFLLVAAAQQIWEGYGVGFLGMMASIYPGYEVGGWGSVISGTLYAVLDGAVCGFVITWLYNRLANPAA